MKTRNSFVSNSSSSSFVLVVPEDVHNDIMSDMDKNERNILNNVLTNSEFFGHKVKILKNANSNEGYYYNSSNSYDPDELGIILNEDDDWDDFFYKTLEKYEELAEKRNNVIHEEMDM